MTVEKFLQFVISHNATIIEVLIGLTLLAVLFLSIRMFLFAKEPSGASSNLDMSQLEGTLKQILEKAGQVPVPSAEGLGGSSEDSQKLLAEISNLKTELEARQNQIETLKSAPAAEGGAPAAGLSDEDKSKLESQIQELQAKLSEYEIISEDIADLSFYKEQNVKLQKELDSLKSGGGAVAPAATPAPAAVAVAAAEPVAAPTPAAAPPVMEAVPAVEPEIVGKSKVEEVATIADPISDPFAEAAASSAPAAEAEKNLIDDDLMAEFAAAVEKQKASSETPAAAPNPSPTAPDAPAAEPVVDLGQMDMDKMMAEAADIKTDVPEVAPEEALGTGLDENKLLQEAAALEGVTSEDKKLMGDFENFVKKSES